MKLEKIQYPLPMIVQNQSFTTLEKRAVYQALKYIDQGFDVQEELFEKGFTITVNFKDLNYGNWSRFVTQLQKLRVKGIDNVTDKKYKGTNWVQSINAERGGDVIIHFTAPATQLLMELKKGYANLQLDIIMNFKSPFTQRMYELLSHYNNTGRKAHVELDELYENIKIPQSYNVTKVKKRILDKAQEEFKTVDSDLSFTYKVVRGRNEKGNISDIGFKFDITRHIPTKEKDVFNESKENKSLDERQLRADKHLIKYNISDIELRNEILFDEKLLSSFFNWNSKYTKGEFKDIRDNGDVAGKLLIHLGLRKSKKKNPNQLEII